MNGGDIYLLIIVLSGLLICVYDYYTRQRHNKKKN